MFPEATQLVCGEVGTHPGLSDSKTHGLYQDISVLIILGGQCPSFLCLLLPNLWFGLVRAWLFHTSSSHVGEEGVAGASRGSGSVLLLIHWGRDSSFGRLGAEA